MQHKSYDRLKGRSALVFGAGSSGPGWGNGKAAAVLYAREGARVAVVDIDMDAANETRRLIESEGYACEAYQADVTSGEQIAKVVAQTQAAFGGIDILHNNVGITRMGSVVDMSEADWQLVLDTNLTSVFLTCKHVIPIMLEQGSGAIVNISSLASIQVNHYPYMSYYAAKSGLNHLTRAMAVQYAPNNIRVNAVLPGVMDTPLIYKQISDQFESQEAMIKARNAASPMGRMGNAWDIAYASLFLASDESNYITGVCLPVDGGKSCAGC
ncbi:SDR family NAD(P)-dependent oxidoreductase [Pollutimonas harenae]|uniref:SDR family oxidoreductase n=1 Tax=Pollutimonas harenae TaxID=657015 RepID=A0A853H176_9BURK|nr:SDR family NAD(P)-dependent oxidoreductase [Pollutimonas harenae]NYT84323.1 SDR family oxidoreductase [Pollutimonas harenae]TEA73275.1 SDR family oxidoreductase [Pollutimonas harenae]